MQYLITGGAGFIERQPGGGASPQGHGVDVLEDLGRSLEDPARGPSGITVNS